MIEIIREEEWDNKPNHNSLPRNIKQIGTPDVGDRIYIEGEAYQTMHSYGRHTGKTVYIMLGRYDDFAGHTCIFIESTVEMNEITFHGGQPVWSDETWGMLYKKLQPEHESMIIVGWAIDVCGEYPHMTAQLEHIHQTYFGGTHQILFLMDSIEQEEVFYSNRNGYLKRREGFYIYYDKSIPNRMENAMQARYEDRGREETYREYINSRNAKSNYRAPQRKQGGSPLTTLLLLAAVVALGYSAFRNYQKMDEMQQALNNMKGMQSMVETEVVEEIVHVEDVIGSVEAKATERGTETEQVQSSEIVPSTENVTKGEQAETQATVESIKELSEAEKYIAQGYYIVQKGDSLASICQKIYNTTAMMDKICEVNGIKNPDAIYAGQYLELPK